MRQLLSLLLLAALPVLSQSQNDRDLFKFRLDQVKNAASPEAKRAVIDDLVNEIQKAALAATRGSFRHYLNQVETNRQMGASAGASGSTSVTVSPLLANIFGISLEQGSLMKSVNGSTVTFQLNPAGIVCASKHQDAAKALPGENCIEAWKRVAFSVSFDQSRGKTPAGLVPLGDQFSEARVHIDLRPSTTSQERLYTRRFNTLANTGGDLWARVGIDPEFVQWTTNTTAALNAASADDLEPTWYRALAQLRAILTRVDKPLMTRTGRLYRDVFARAIAIDAAKVSQFAFEAGINRPDVAAEAIANGIVAAGQRPPSLFSTRLIYSRGFGPLTVVLNGSTSWFTEVKPGMDKGRWRDYMFSGEGRFRLPSIIPGYGAPSLALGGLFGDLRQAPLGIPLPVTRPGASSPDNINLPGKVRLLNARLEMPTANRNVVVPLSFTYSNRTDLIKEQDVRVSIGLSVRFDSLFPSAAK
jgi:hypothetical protein